MITIDLNKVHGMVREEGARMNNAKIRNELSRTRLKYWELARIMGIHEGSLSRKLRDELPEEEQNRIVDLIRQHVKQTGGIV